MSWCGEPCLVPQLSGLLGVLFPFVVYFPTDGSHPGLPSAVFGWNSRNDLTRIPQLYMHSCICTIVLAQHRALCLLGQNAFFPLQSCVGWEKGFGPQCQKAWTHVLDSHAPATNVLCFLMGNMGMIIIIFISQDSKFNLTHRVNIIMINRY